jgi:hypothetical protein
MCGRKGLGTKEEWRRDKPVKRKEGRKNKQLTKSRGENRVMSKCRSVNREREDYGVEAKQGEGNRSEEENVVERNAKCGEDKV